MAKTDDSITVTTATRTAEELRADLGLPAADQAVPAAKPAETPASPEQEADSTKPDPEISDAARALRRNRADVRKAKIQEEINTLTRQKHTEAAELDRLRRERAALADPKPVAEKPAGESAPSFKFPSFEQYQSEHPDHSYEDYTDARTDARVAWSRSIDEAKSKQEATERATAQHLRARQTAETTFQAHQETFKADHPDYDEKLTTVSLEGANPDLVTDLRQLIVDAGADGPAMLYHFAAQPEDLKRLLASTTPQQLLRTFGAIEYSLKTAAPSPTGAIAPKPTPAPAPPPSKPATDAPTPLEQVRGSAQHTRSLQQIADDSDDADAYIAERKRQLKAG